MPALVRAWRRKASDFTANAMESPSTRMDSVGLWKPTEFSAPMKMLR